MLKTTLEPLAPLASNESHKLDHLASANLLHLAASEPVPGPGHFKDAKPSKPQHAACLSLKMSQDI